MFSIEFIDLHTFWNHQPLHSSIQPKAGCNRCFVLEFSNGLPADRDEVVGRNVISVPGKHLSEFYFPYPHTVVMRERTIIYGDFAAERFYWLFCQINHIFAEKRNRESGANIGGDVCMRRSELETSRNWGRKWIINGMIEMAPWQSPIKFINSPCYCFSHSRLPWRSVVALIANIESTCLAFLQEFVIAYFPIYWFAMRRFADLNHLAI